MPEYMYIINDPSSYPDLSWNEVIVSSGVYDVSLLSPLHNVEIGPQIAGYNRMRITTKYLDVTSRKPASAYHGPLANKDYKVSSGNPALQSPRAPSLTSRVKTGGKQIKINPLEKGGYYVSKTRSWKKGHNPCSKGYKIQRINNAWWCVKQ